MKTNQSDLIYQLQTLKTVNASERLKERIEAEVKYLPVLTTSNLGLNIYRLAYSLALSLLFLFFLGGGLVWAAEASQPGDFLYPIKRFHERIELSLTTNPLKRISLQKEFTERRLRELKHSAEIEDENQIKDANEAYTQAVHATVSEVEQVSNEAVEKVDEVKSSLQNQSNTLKEVASSQPESQREIFDNTVEMNQEALETIEEMQEAMVNVSPSPILPPPTVTLPVEAEVKIETPLLDIQADVNDSEEQNQKKDNGLLNDIELDLKLSL